jgi:hypothetical protein
MSDRQRSRVIIHNATKGGAFFQAGVPLKVETWRRTGAVSPVGGEIAVGQTMALDLFPGIDGLRIRPKNANAHCKPAEWLRPRRILGQPASRRDIELTVFVSDRWYGLDVTPRVGIN